jgi:hypothetical protein
MLPKYEPATGPPARKKWLNRLSLDHSPYKHLMEDEQVRVWLENMERGSIYTASMTLRKFG